MGLDPISSVADLASQVVQRIWPDKTAEDKQQLAAVLALAQGQMQTNQQEAASSDPLQHWRGALGWVCVMGFFVNYPLQWIVGVVAQFTGHPIHIPPMDMGQLWTLTGGMLGLGTLHVAERIKGAS